MQYGKVFCRSENSGVTTKTVQRIVDEEIDKLIEPYMEQLSGEQLEEVKDFMYGTALIAEQEGFQLGIIYAIKLLLFYLKM